MTKQEVLEWIIKCEEGMRSKMPYVRKCVKKYEEAFLKANELENGN